MSIHFPMRFSPLSSVAAGLCACLAAASAAVAGETVGWRGDGSGLFPSAEVPTCWDSRDGTHILWRAEVGTGQSTPVPAGGRIFLGAERDALVCVDGRTGNVLWRADDGFACLPPQWKVNQKRYPAGKGGGYSVATPVTDGSAVYMCHATGIVAAFTLDGKRKWVRHFAEPQVPEYGRSASPVLAGGKLVVSLGGLIALDPATGETLWQNRAARPAYGTPSPTKIGGMDVLVTPNGDLVALDDGRLLAEEIAQAQYTTPLVRDGVAYFLDCPAVAVLLPAELPAGARAATTKKLWENEDIEGEFFASPLWHEGLLYCQANEGVLYVLDSATGRIVWQRKLDIPSAAPEPGMPAANLYASPTLVGRHLLLCNDAGQSLLLTCGREYKEVARNYLDAGSGACPMAMGNALLLRAGKWLYAIGKN